VQPRAEATSIRIYMSTAIAAFRSLEASKIGRHSFRSYRALERVRVRERERERETEREREREREKEREKERKKNGPISEKIGARAKLNLFSCLPTAGWCGVK
jgi:hypothetical protein